MTGFILRRLLYTLAVMLVASIAIFYSLRVAPGDPGQCNPQPDVDGGGESGTARLGSASTFRCTSSTSSI